MHVSNLVQLFVFAIMTRFIAFGLAEKQQKDVL
jgi:hypothetical protein